MPRPIPSRRLSRLSLRGEGAGGASRDRRRLRRLRDLYGYPDLYRPEPIHNARTRGRWGVHEGVGPDPNQEEEDVQPCWCGEREPLYDEDGLDATCGGSGTLYCRCGGDQCVCHHHGEVECQGCEDCEERGGGDDEDAEMDDGDWGEDDFEDARDAD